MVAAPFAGNRIRLTGRLIRPFRGTMAAYEALRRAPGFPLDRARIRRAHRVRAGASHASGAAGGLLCGLAYRRPFRPPRHDRPRRIDGFGPGGAHRTPRRRRVCGALRHRGRGRVRGTGIRRGGGVVGARADHLPAGRAGTAAPGGAVGGVGFAPAGGRPPCGAVDVRAGRRRRGGRGARGARAGALSCAAGLRGRACRYAGGHRSPLHHAAGGGGPAAAAVLAAQTGG